MSSSSTCSWLPADSSSSWLGARPPSCSSLLPPRTIGSCCSCLGAEVGATRLLCLAPPAPPLCGLDEEDHDERLNRVRPPRATWRRSAAAAASGSSATWRMSQVPLPSGGVAAAASDEAATCTTGSPLRTASTAAWHACHWPDQSRPTEP
uniref:Uncharacterized protein n=1 Tax=Arundo donax TaxID=35708 RepID=A0A0A9GGW2_ARUDO